MNDQLLQDFLSDLDDMAAALAGKYTLAQKQSFTRSIALKLNPTRPEWKAAMEYLVENWELKSLPRQSHFRKALHATRGPGVSRPQATNCDRCGGTGCLLFHRIDGWDVVGSEVCRCECYKSNLASMRDIIDAGKAPLGARQFSEINGAPIDGRSTDRLPHLLRQELRERRRQGGRMPGEEVANAVGL